MGVVTRYGNAVKNPTAINPASAADAEGQVRSAYSKIAVSSDSATSTHILARVPSNGRLLPGSALYYTALTGLTDYDVGMGRDGAVISGKGDVLVNGEDIHTAGTVALNKALGTGNLGKRYWEIAGYSADPGGMLDIIGTVNADCSTTGSIEAFVNSSKG